MRKTELRNAEICANGCIDIYLNLLSTEGVRLHSITIEPDSDLAERFEAVNRSIVNDCGWPALAAEDWGKVEAECAKLHTDEVKTAYAAWKVEQEALLEKLQ